MEIEYIYASLLLHSSGKEISEENLKRVLEAAGAEIDEIRIKSVVAALKRVNIDEALKAAVPAFAAPAAAPSPTPSVEAPPEEKKEEEEKEEEEEEEVAGGLEALFG